MIWMIPPVAWDVIAQHQPHTSKQGRKYTQHDNSCPKPSEGHIRVIPRSGRMNFTREKVARVLWRSPARYSCRLFKPSPSGSQVAQERCSLRWVLRTVPARQESETPSPTESGPNAICSEPPTWLNLTFTNPVTVVEPAEARPGKVGTVRELRKAHTIALDTKWLHREESQTGSGAGLITASPR